MKLKRKPRELPLALVISFARLQAFKIARRQRLAAAARKRGAA